MADALSAIIARLVAQHSDLFLPTSFFKALASLLVLLQSLNTALKEHDRVIDVKV